MKKLTDSDRDIQLHTKTYNAYARAHTCVDTKMHTYTWTHTCRDIYIHVRRHTPIQVEMHTYM